MRLTGFTLIELLVVITIIVVLLALLTPALDKAIYQAELTVCGANQKALAGATLNYAMGARKFYPYREIIENGGKGDGHSQPILIYRNNNDDERPVLRSFLDLNKNLQDPLVDPVDLTLTRGGVGNAQIVVVYSSLEYWAGYRYVVPPGGKGMRKLGDGLEWEGASYRMIASDHDAIAKSANNLQSSHPDADGVTHNMVRQSDVNPYDPAAPGGVSQTQLTYSIWTADVRTWERGAVDKNVVFDDGSVLRYNAVAADPRAAGDDRMARLPVFSSAQGFKDGADYWLNVPKANR